MCFFLIALPYPYSGLKRPQRAKTAQSYAPILHSALYAVAPGQRPEETRGFYTGDTYSETIYPADALFARHAALSGLERAEER
jgi:hypothetical protein